MRWPVPLRCCIPHLTFYEMMNNELNFSQNILAYILLSYLVALNVSDFTLYLFSWCIVCTCLYLLTCVHTPRQTAELCSLLDTRRVPLCGPYQITL